ncbi:MULTISPECIES: DUF1707 SHOCT-like domain-containing protein [unclassified Luteococcus]|uniref:DUF1707 SHOCT-like domain-containing protein n=1 Tax=unclassified Luteococcus TaxID=2639923 RepID=UPI00313DC8EA
MEELTPKPYRIGDEERDRAVGQLREHHAAGRLDVAEFDERMGAALAARTSTELAALFDDLPPLDGHLPVIPTDRPAEMAPRSSNVWNWRQGVSGAAFPAALVICFATGWQYWWIMLIPMVISGALLGGQGNQDDEAPGKDAKSLPGGS